jgi:hypothetical protein
MEDKFVQLCYGTNVLLKANLKDVWEVVSTFDNMSYFDVKNVKLEKDENGDLSFFYFFTFI